MPSWPSRTWLSSRFERRARGRVRHSAPAAEITPRRVIGRKTVATRGSSLLPETSRARSHTARGAQQNPVNPASRAIRLASGVATTENAPFSPHAQGRNPPEPARARPSGNGRPSASDTGARTAITSTARASQGSPSVARIAAAARAAPRRTRPDDNARQCDAATRGSRMRSAAMLPRPENTSMPVRTRQIRRCGRSARGWPFRSGRSR